MVYREATGFVRYARNLTRGEGEGGGMQMGGGRGASMQIHTS